MNARSMHFRPRTLTVALVALGAVVATGAQAQSSTARTEAPRNASSGREPLHDLAQGGWRDELERALADAGQAGQAARETREAAREQAARAEADAEHIQEMVEEALESASFSLESGGFQRQVVKNAPFTADVIYETRQALADGNRIVRKSQSSFARDGMGRTRQQRGPNTVLIDDPVAGRAYVLRPQSKTAVRLPRLGMAGGDSIPRGPLAAPAPPVPPTPPTPGASPAPPTPPVPPAVVHDVEVRPGRVVVQKKSGDGRDAVHVEVIRIGRDVEVPNVPAPPEPPQPPALPPLTFNGQSLNLPVGRGKGVTEPLGSREFDGVRADGTRTTYTMPAGAIGNEKSLVTTSERWFAPALQVVVLATTSDPRAGETVYRLANLKRGEPPADLFRLPPEVKVRGERKG